MAKIIKIEKGVRIPDLELSGKGYAPTSKYPFPYMAIGDSFNLPKSTKKNLSAYAANLISYWQKALPDRRFIHRIQSSGDIRIWRVKKAFKHEVTFVTESGHKVRLGEMPNGRISWRKEIVTRLRKKKVL